MDRVVVQLATRNPQFATSEKVYKLSTKTGDHLIRQAEQGERIKKIRKTLDMTQDQFAGELTKAMRAFGLESAYRKDQVSRLESGGRRMTAEEAVAISSLIRDRPVVIWLVFGGAKEMGATGFNKAAG